MTVARPRERFFWVCLRVSFAVCLCVRLCFMSDRFECSSTESARYHWPSLYKAVVCALGIVCWIQCKTTLLADADGPRTWVAITVADRPRTYSLQTQIIRGREICRSAHLWFLHTSTSDINVIISISYLSDLTAWWSLQYIWAHLIYLC